MSISRGCAVEAGNPAPINGRTMARAMKLTLFLVNCIILSIGNISGPLLLRLYFIQGGNSIWLSSWLETSAWPILLIPLFINYLYRQPPHGNHEEAKVIFMTPSLFVACLVIGILTGLDDYLHAYGLACIPISTSALLFSSRLAFQAVFALLIVKHKFTPYSINAIVLQLIGSITLGLRANGDTPDSESRLQYLVGFMLTIAAAALYGAVLPLIELACIKAKQVVTYSLVLEMQIVMGFFATAFCTVAMLVNKDFQAIQREASEFKLGESKYYVLLVFSGIVWQFFFLGIVGVTACTSSLHAGVVISALLPVTEILAAFFFDEKFTADKGVSLVVCVWGFTSYFYGEYKQSKKEEKATLAETETPTI